MSRRAGADELAMLLCIRESGDEAGANGSQHHECKYRDCESAS